MANKKNRFYIGTSGWHYEHWRDVFYKEGISPKKYLDFYKEIFSTVEINRTFYSLPKREVFEGYAKSASKNFLFSVKASRFITHVKRLLDAKEPLKRLFQAVEGLKTHLGP